MQIKGFVNSILYVDYKYKISIIIIYFITIWMTIIIQRQPMIDISNEDNR